MIISSTGNPRIKNIVKLKDRKARQEKGLTIVEGVREVMRAHEAGVPFEEIYVCPAFYKRHGEASFLKRLSDSGLSFFEVNEAVYEKIAFGDRHEGLLALCRPALASFADLPQKKNPLFVIVENVEKPGNLGAILRTCDGAGVDAVIVSDTKTDVFNPNCIRASLGAVFTVFVSQGENKDVLAFLKKRGVSVCAATPTADKAYYEEDLRGGCALVLGSEQAGLSEFWMKQADTRVFIPMEGEVDSLNVATTAAILVYEAQRQRKRVS